MSRITQGTPQQEAFWDVLATGGEHVVLEARAGSGKSSSCLEGLHRVLAVNPSARWRYAAFNRSIAQEFAPRAPKQVEVSTLHSYGFAAIRAASDRGVNVDEKKTGLLLDDFEPDMRKRNWPLHRSICKAVGLCKNLYIVDPLDRPDELWEACAEFGCLPDSDERGRFLGLVDAVLAASSATTRLIDFDDMIWLPVAMGLSFPAINGLIVDEAQDLNPCQHRLVERIAGDGRLVIVGDPFQSIYAFRGADPESMPLLTSRLAATPRGVKTMPLTVTFRCPTSHVALAKRFVPDIEAAPNAKHGRIDEDVDWEEMLATVTPGQMVICRTNAPLIKGCLALVARGVPACVRGREFGVGLLDLIRRFGAGGMIRSFLRNLREWRDTQVADLAADDAPASKIDAVVDRAAALEALAETCDSVGDLADQVRAMFSDEDDRKRVVFSSVHRAKGLESDSVWWVQSPALRTKSATEEQQERNIKYVATTRSKHRLAMVTSPERDEAATNGRRQSRFAFA